MVDGDRIRLDLKLNSENFLSSLLFFSFSKVNVRILVFHGSLSLSRYFRSFDYFEYKKRKSLCR